MAWVLDLDGVVWLGEQPVPGSAEAVEQLRARGERVLFATNDSSSLVAEKEDKLERFGIPAAGDVVSSAMAAAQVVEPGERVLVCGGPGLVEAIERRGAVALDGRSYEGSDLDAVVVGFHWDFDYGVMRRATVAIRGGARFLASNDDATYPTPDGLIPGGGAIVASIAYATGRQPLVAGKPHQPMADLVHALAGEDEGVDGVMVGDRADTDGAFAKTLGYRFALVLTGVTTAADLPVSPTPDVVVDDLASLITHADFGVPPKSHRGNTP